MTIEELKERKRQKGYTYAQMSELSGVPVGTIQKIFTGETTNPRYDTLHALERLFQKQDMACERAVQYGARKVQGQYTIDDYMALPDDQRVELIDGVFYEMLAPTTTHQRIGAEIYRQIANYIIENDGECIPMVAPVDVQLDCDEKTMVQPDVVIICHDDRMTVQRVFGAPDFALEVISPSTKRKDFTLKLSKYEDAGVREYWIVDPYQKAVIVYFFESETSPTIYGLQGKIPVNIYDGKLEIDMDRIAKYVIRE